MSTPTATGHRLFQPPASTSMKESMSIETTAAGAAGWKLIGGLAGMGAIGAGLAAIVVMSMTKPKSDQEWRVALISTVMGSIGGGCAVIMHFGLQAWAYDPFGLVALLGLVFGCGLPGWALVRWAFNYMERRKDADLTDVVKDVKGVL